MQILKTDGGAHPADKWAEFTADNLVGLIQVDNDSVTPEAHNARAAKRDLRPILFKILESHFGDVQAFERKHCDKHVKGAAAAQEHADKPLDVTPHLGVMDEVFAAFDATPFKDHFAKPEVREVLTRMVGQHTANTMNIERKTHHDRQKATAKKEA